MTKQLVSRQEAIKKGLKKYFTGITCSNGHIAYRAILSGSCMECIQAATKKRRQEIKNG